MNLKKPRGRRLSVIPPGVLEEKDNQDEIDTNMVIGFFKEINPMYDEFFKIRAERVACKKLIKKIGMEKLRNLFSWYLGVMNKQYCPIFTSPTGLVRKLGDLIAFGKKENNPKNKKGGVFIIGGKKDLIN